MQPKHDPNWVIIAKIGRSFGLTGHLKLNVFSEIPESVDNFFVFIDQWQILEAEFVWGSNPLIKIPEYNSPEAARYWTNKFLAIPRSALPELNENEYYWHDLIGLKVINKNKENLGIVSRVESFGAQPNIIIKNNNTETIIPILDDIIITKDFSNKLITVDWDLDF